MLFFLRKGATTVPGGCEAVGFFHLDSDNNVTWPDIELMFVGGSPLTEPQILVYLHYYILIFFLFYISSFQSFFLGIY